MWLWGGPAFHRADSPSWWQNPDIQSVFVQRPEGGQFLGPVASRTSPGLSAKNSARRQLLRQNRPFPSAGWAQEAEQRLPCSHRPPDRGGGQLRIGGGSVPRTGQAGRRASILGPSSRRSAPAHLNRLIPPTRVCGHADGHFRPQLPSPAGQKCASVVPPEISSFWPVTSGRHHPAVDGNGALLPMKNVVTCPAVFPKLRQGEDFRSCPNARPMFVPSRRPFRTKYLRENVTGPFQMVRPLFGVRL